MEAQRGLGFPLMLESMADFKGATFSLRQYSNFARQTLFLTDWKCKHISVWFTLQVFFTIDCRLCSCYCCCWRSSSSSLLASYWRVCSYGGRSYVLLEREWTDPPFAIVIVCVLLNEHDLWCVRCVLLWRLVCVWLSWRYHTIRYHTTRYHKIPVAPVRQEWSLW